MKALRFLGYYSLILAYYLAVFAILIFTFDPPIVSQPVSPLGLLFSLAAIGSPFLTADKIIDYTYPGGSKRQFALIMGIIMTMLTAFHLLGVQLNRGLGLIQLPFYAFNLCVVISLYRYNAKHSIKENFNATPNKELQFSRGIKNLKSFYVAIRLKLAFALGIIVFVLIITNPSLQAFKEHLGKYNNGVVSRETNLFVCSIYRFNSRRYVGIMENFFFLSPQASNSSLSQSRYKESNTTDGVVMFDTTSKKNTDGKENRSHDNMDKELDAFIKSKKKR
jgi:hypothetical protein